MNQIEKNCSWKADANIHSNLFVVDHGIYLLQFAIQTLQFGMEKLSTRRKVFS